MNGAEDPWKYAGIQKFDLDYKSNYESILIDCDTCGHCVDLGPL